MKNTFRHVLSVALVLVMALTVMSFGAFAAEGTNVAKIGDTEYATLADAMAEANKAAGDYTITMLKDSAEVFAFGQKSGVNITIDGDGNTFSGKITLNAGAGSLTFNDAIIAPANKQTIYLAKSTAPDVTFDGCTLKGNNMSGTIVYCYASSTSNDVKIIDCTADNLQYIISNRQTGCKSILVENVTATNMIYLIRSLKCQSVTVKNVTCDAVIAINIKNDAAGGELVLEDVSLSIRTYNGSLYAPVSGNGAGKNWTVTLKGINQFYADGVAYEDLSWFSGNAGYQLDIEAQNGTKFGSLTDIATVTKAGDTVKLLKDSDETIEFPYGVILDKNGFTADNVTVERLPVVKVGENEYSSIQKAINACADGDTITVIADHELLNSDVAEKASGMYPYIAVTDKKVTIDLNGKTITANPSLDANMLAIFYAGGTGELTLKDSSEAKTGTVDVTMADGTKAYSMFTALGTDGAKMYIESGNYSIDKIEYGQSMIYSGQNKQIFVSGGNFYLGNAGVKDTGTEGAPFQPWMYNAHGDGAKVIVVTGGTYNVDPTHYHGEANFPTCYAPVEEDGKWTVKIVHTPSAAATCQAAQTCTECGEELDAIKECTFENYVSNGDATCKADGTKTAECIYACGATDTVADEGSATGHIDADGNNRCDFCNAEFCSTCGKIHDNWMAKLFCLIIDFFRLITSYFKSL